MQKFFLYIIPMALLMSCTTPRYMYAPTRVNAPLLQKKGELQLNGSVAALRGFDASAAYAFASQFAVMVNGSWRNHTQGKSSSTVELLSPTAINYRRKSIDIGVGWFKRPKGSNWQVEVFGGLGTGKIFVQDNGFTRQDTLIKYSRFYKSKLSRFFLQPEFGANPSEFMQIAFFVRFQFVKFTHIQTNYSSSEMRSYRIPESPSTFGIPESPPSFVRFMEPGFSIRFYLRSLPQLGFESNFLLSRMYNSDIDAIPIHFSIGVHARFLPKKIK